MSLNPRGGGKYRHPMELAFHAGLAFAERRALLLGWAADANCLIEDPLSRRDPRTGALASLDEIREALALLDEEIARRASSIGGLPLPVRANVERPRPHPPTPSAKRPNLRPLNVISH